MMTKTGYRETQKKCVLCADLRLTLGERGLLRLALEAIQAVDLQPVVLEERMPMDLRPQMMLTLLTYCYSAKIYGSRDVELAIGQDSTVRYICARAHPD